MQTIIEQDGLKVEVDLRTPARIIAHHQKMNQVFWLGDDFDKELEKYLNLIKGENDGNR